jgi:hypothetical protein
VFGKARKRRPDIGLGRFDEAGRDRVLADVLERGAEVLVGVDHPGREAPAPEVAVTAVAEVEPLRIATVQVLHPARELLLRRLDDEVVVRPHQADRVHSPAVPVDALLEEAREGVAVSIVAENERAEHAARRDVEETVRERRAKHARHVSTVACVRRQIAEATAGVALLLHPPCLLRTGPRV